MTKHTWILLTLATVAALALGGCAQQAATEEEAEPVAAEEEAEPAAAEEEAEPAAAEEEAEPAAAGAAAAEELEVCFVHNSFVDDQGWSFAHERGRTFLEEANLAGVTTSYVDGIFDTGGVDAAKVFQDLSTQGCNLIFGTSFGYNDPVLQVGESNPDVIFQNYDQYLLADNVGSHRLATQEGFYLTGIVAGMTTESNIIGIVGTFPIPQIVREINGFALGVQSVNPDATVKVIWLNSWYDPPKEAQTAEALITVGADVVQHLTSSPAAVQAAEAKGVYSIGFENDQSEFGPEFYLTSMTFDWGAVYVDITQSVIDGTWESDELWYFLADGAMSLGPFGPTVTDDVKQAVEETQAAIISGDLQVFTGPIKDQEGNVRIPEGETLSIEDGNQIDWFVEGIDGTVSE